MTAPIEPDEATGEPSTSPVSESATAVMKANLDDYVRDTVSDTELADAPVTEP